MKFYWPIGYGPIEGTLMILFYVFFVTPIVFLLLCIEVGIVDAWKTMRGS